jgi:hypothetical protein
VLHLLCCICCVAFAVLHLLCCICCVESAVSHLLCCICCAAFALYNDIKASHEGWSVQDDDIVWASWMPLASFRKQCQWNRDQITLVDEAWRTTSARLLQSMQALNITAQNKTHIT